MRGFSSFADNAGSDAHQHSASPISRPQRNCAPQRAQHWEAVSVSSMIFGKPGSLASTRIIISRANPAPARARVNFLPLPQCIQNV
jgi:hypothetical protein